MINNERTRMSLWSTYREEIYKNDIYTNLAKSKNEKFDVLYKRLLKVFPDYEKHFSLRTRELNVVFTPKKEPKKVEIGAISYLLEQIEQIEKGYEATKTSFANLEFNSSDTKVNEIVDELVTKTNIDVTWADRTQLFKIYNEKDLGEQKMKVKKINVAIDGPSGSGKSTVAQMIAKKYGMHYINTGSLYRAVALYAYENNIDIENGCEDIAQHFDKINIELDNDHVVLNGKDVTQDVRKDLISSNASKVAAITLVREFTRKILNHYVEGKGIVMDGRDITSKVMPEAEVRVFLDTSPEVRAKRRYEQNIKMGFEANFDRILQEIEDRDFRDKNREKDPLIIVEGVTYIDSSDMNISQVAHVINLLVEEKNKVS